MAKLKVIPGRGLSGRALKARLKNRTLEGQSFGSENYTLDEDMVEFTKLSKVEQVNAARANAQKVKEIKRNLETVANANKKRMDELEINRKVQEKLKQIAAEQLQKQQTLNSNG